MKLHSPIEKPYDKKIIITQGYHSGHHALDIRNYDFDAGKNLRHCVMERSKIIDAGKGKTYGENFVLLKGMETGYYYLYCHNHLLNGINIWDMISAGRPFAMSDLSGDGSTGYHLHLEILSSTEERLNPWTIFSDNECFFEWETK